VGRSNTIWIALSGIAGFGVLVVLVGCTTEIPSERPLRMPTVLPADPQTPPAKLSADDVLAQAIAAVGRNDLAAAAAVIGMLPAVERGAVVGELVVTIVSQDLAQAGRVAQAMPPGQLLSEATEVAAHAMLAHDPAVAVAWALGSISPTVDYATRQAVADGWAGRDPQGAMQHFLGLPGSVGRNELLVYAAAGWAKRAATAALAWARALPSGEDQLRVATSVSFAVARTEPERADELLAMLPEGREQRLLIGAIGQTWIARNPTAAWAWARKFPPGPARYSAINGIETGLGRWRYPRSIFDSRGISASDRLAMEAMGSAGALALGDAKAMAVGLDRDRVLRREFEDALRESPARAASWLTALPLPDRRDEMVDEVARRWLTTNPPAAKEWMEQNRLPPERQAQLRREVLP